MLDRKTKDYEASDELLEDRIKQSRIFSGMYYFLCLFFLLIMAYICIQTINIDFTKIKETASLWRLLFIELVSWMLALAFIVYSLMESKGHADDARYYKTLLFLKKNYLTDKEKQDDEKRAK